MDDKRLEQFRNRITFISGSSKNAGKTTFLNYLLPRLRGRGLLAYLTIGVDGEKIDRVYGIEKPSIKTMDGDYILTAESMVNRSGALFEVCHVFPWKTALGNLMLLKTIRSGFVELVGPENNYQLGRILRLLKEEIGVNTILVDGAVNRITQISVEEDVFFYYIMTITPENKNRSLETIRTLSLLNTLPYLNRKDSIIEKGFLEVEGALTSTLFNKIGKNIHTLIVEDFTKVFLSFKDLKALCESVSIVFRRKLSIESLVFNLRNVNKKSFVEDLNRITLEIPYLFNPYREEIPVYD
jgi:hypothetical protein